jgi:hypothetical protein
LTCVALGIGVSLNTFLLLQAVVIARHVKICWLLAEYGAGPNWRVYTRLQSASKQSNSNIMVGINKGAGQLAKRIIDPSTLKAKQLLAFLLSLLFQNTSKAAS